MEASLIAKPNFNWAFLTVSEASFVMKLSPLTIRHLSLDKLLLSTFSAKQKLPGNDFLTVEFVSTKLLLSPWPMPKFTEAGLFRQLKLVPGHKAIIRKEHVSQFFEQLLAASKEKSKTDVERLMQLYDSSTWVYTRGDKSVPQVIDYPGVSLTGYSQPNRFSPLYVELKDRWDSVVDRVLIYQPHRLSARKTHEFITKLNQ